MKIDTGTFPAPIRHHEGWFRVFRFDGAVEVWLGSKWILVFR